MLSPCSVLELPRTSQTAHNYLITICTVFPNLNHKSSVLSTLLHFLLKNPLILTYTIRSNQPAAPSQCTYLASALSCAHSSIIVMGLMIGRQFLASDSNKTAAALGCCLIFCVAPFSSKFGPRTAERAVDRTGKKMHTSHCMSVCNLLASLAPIFTFRVSVETLTLWITLTLVLIFGCSSASGGRFIINLTFSTCSLGRICRSVRVRKIIVCERWCLPALHYA